MADYDAQPGRKAPPEPELSEAIVHRDDDRALVRKIFTVIPGLAARAAGETATIDPHHHGAPGVCVRGIRPDVHRQAVFVGWWLPRWGRRSGWRGLRCCRAWGCALSSWGCGAAASGRAGATATATGAGHVGDARRTERVRLAHTVPLRGRLRRLPAVLTDRRCRERNAFEDADVRMDGAGDALEQAGVDLHLLGNHGGGAGHRKNYGRKHCEQRNGVTPFCQIE